MLQKVTRLESVPTAEETVLTTEVPTKESRLYTLLNNPAQLFYVLDFCHLLTLIKIKKIFQLHYQSVKQLGSKSGPTLCRASSGSNRFQYCKYISNTQKVILLFPTCLKLCIELT